MTKSAEFVINGLTVAGLTIAALSCTDNEKQQSINPSQSPLAGAKTEATLETPPTYDTRLQTPAETAVIIAAATATRMPETPTTAPATKTPFPPTKVPDTATAVPPTKAPDTATAVPATAVPDKTPAVLSTPEANRFVPYGVYANEDTFVATLPDGRIIVGAKKTAYPCSNNNYYVFNFVTFSKYDPNKEFVGFDDPNGIARRIGVSLMGDGNKLAMVTMKEKGHVERAPAGEFTCPTTEDKSKVQLVGTGKDTLMAYAQKTGVVSRVDAKKALQQLESIVGKLPD